MPEPNNLPAPHNPQPQNEDLAYFFQMTTDLLAVLSPKSDILRINPSFESVLGWPAGDLLGKSLWSFTHRDDLAAAQTEMSMLGHQKTETTFHLRLRQQGGSYRILACTVRARDNLRYLVAQPMADIAGNAALAKVGLMQDEHVFQRLVEKLPVGVLLQGPHAEIILSNQAALNMLGLSEEQLRGRTSFDPEWNIIHEDGSPFPGEEHPVPQAIKTKKPIHGQVMGVYRPKTKDRVWLLVDADPQLDVYDEVKQVICIFYDITERYQTQAELHQTLDELKLFNRRMTRQTWADYLHDSMAPELRYQYHAGEVFPLDPNAEAAETPPEANEQTILSRPLTLQNEPIGGLTLRNPQEMQEEAPSLLEAVAAQLAIHLETLRLTEENQRALAKTEYQAQRLSLLNELGAALSEAKSIEEAVLIVTERAMEIINLDWVTVTVLFDVEGKVVTYTAEFGADLAIETIPLAQAEQILGQAQVTVADVQDTTNSETNPGWQRLAEQGLRSVLSLPLTVGDRVLGTLSFASRQANVYEPADENLGLGIASFLGAVIENRRLLDRTRAALNEANIFQQLIEAAEQGIGLASPDGVIRYTNPALARLLGFDNPEISEGELIFQFYDEERVALFKAEILPTLMQTGRWSGQMNMVAKTGQLVPVQQSLFTIKNEQGEITYLANVTTDITQRLADEAEREQLLANMQAAYNRYLNQEWSQYLGQKHQSHFHIEHHAPHPEDETWPDTEANQATPAPSTQRPPQPTETKAENKPPASPQSQAPAVDEPAALPPATITTPIALQGQLLGTFSLQDSRPDRRWSEDEVALVEAVSEQLALTLENLRLFEATQERAAREQITREVTEKIRSAGDAEAILQTTVNELLRTMGVSEAFVDLNVTAPAFQRPSTSVEQTQLKQGDEHAQ